MAIKLSDNSKVKFKRNHKNTFGLLHGSPLNGGTCPGATCGKGGCLDTRDGRKRKTCYVEKITQIYKEVGNTLRENTEQLIGKTKDEMFVVLDEMISSFVSKSKDNLFFRLHWAGDLFSEDYASAWAMVIRKHGNVRFWLYTRSFVPGSCFVLPLIGLPNLSIYLSADPINYPAASAFFEEYKESMPTLGIAWLGDEAPDQESRRWVKCPEVTGKIKNTKDYGACSKCRLCIDRYVSRVKNIQFPIH